MSRLLVVVVLPAGCVRCIVFRPVGLHFIHQGEVLAVGQA
jgi:hypothetical protein